MKTEFEKQFDQMTKFMFIGIIGTWFVGLSVLVAIGYVVYKVLAHFGILG